MINFLLTLTELYYWIVLIYCILSFFPDLKNQYTEMIGQLVEPVLEPIRKFLFSNFKGMPIDFSPLVLILGLYLIQGMLIGLVS